MNSNKKVPFPVKNRETELFVYPKYLQAANAAIAPSAVAVTT